MALCSSLLPSQHQAALRISFAEFSGAVDRAMEQGVRGSDPDDDGLFTGFYEYWDNDVK